MRGHKPGWGGHPQETRRDGSARAETRDQETDEMLEKRTVRRAPRGLAHKRTKRGGLQRRGPTLAGGGGVGVASLGPPSPEGSHGPCISGAQTHVHRKGSAPAPPL